MSRRGSTLTALAAVTLLWASVGGAILAFDGWPARFPGYVPPQRAAMLAAFREGTCFLRQDQPASEWAGVPGCTAAGRSADASGRDGGNAKRAFRTDAALSGHTDPGLGLIGGRGSRRTLLWGDSFAAHLWQGVSALPAARIGRVTQITASGCPPVFDAPPGLPDNCAAINGRARRLVDSGRFGRVIVAGRWGLYDGIVTARQVARTIEVLSRAGIEVVLIARSPILQTRTPYLWDYRHPDQPAPLAAVSRLDLAVRTLSPAVLIEPVDILCADRACPVRSGGELVFWDEGHLTPHGSRLLVGKISHRLFAGPAGRTAAARTGGLTRIERTGVGARRRPIPPARKRPVPHSRQAASSHPVPL